MSKFALNVIRGACQIATADASFALNPNQVNFIVPGYEISPGSLCGNEIGFAVSYGSGYWLHTSSIASSYPGIGTIRAFNSSIDLLKYNDGSFVFGGTFSPGTGDQRIKFSNNGNDDATAEWAARLKAHWSLADVGGSFAAHPGVHGVWGDDCLWWDPFMFWRTEHGGVNAVGANYDDGLVRNFQKLRTLLGEDVLLAGNGGVAPCSGWGSYYGTIAAGACLSIDGGMFENQSNDLMSPTGWDTWTPRFDTWIKAKSTNNRQRYGIVTIYGGTGGLGHAPTSAEKRVALAWACIGGIHLWMTNTSSWDDVVTPGGQFSIPEMGFDATYPKGWLGQPLTDPVRVGSGLWRRTFSEGIVYANTTFSNWSVDSRTVPAQDALFVKEHQVGVVPIQRLQGTGLSGTGLAGTRISGTRIS